MILNFTVFLTIGGSDGDSILERHLRHLKLDNNDPSNLEILTRSEHQRSGRAAEAFLRRDDGNHALFLNADIPGTLAVDIECDALDQAKPEDATAPRENINTLASTDWNIE